MTLTVEIQLRKHYLRAIVSGPFSLRAAQDTYGQVVKAAVAQGRHRILIDTSGVTGAPTQDERYMLGLFVAAEQRILASKAPPVEVHVALIARPPFLDPNRFGETVAVNRGAKLKVSEHLGEALAWLGVSASC